MMDGNVSAADWIKGIGFSVAASVVGGASKLAIRKSWLIQEDVNAQHPNDDSSEVITNDSSSSSSSSSSSVEASLDPVATADITSPLLPSGLPSNSGILPSGGVEQNREQTFPNSITRPACLWRAFAFRYSGYFGMTILNPLCCVMAMNYASPSILAPFSGLTLVWIVLLSHPVIGEKPTTLQVVSAMLIILGEIIVAVFGDHTNNEGIAVEDVRESYLHPPFLLYFVGMVVWVLTLWYFISTGEETKSFLNRFAWGAMGGSITGLQNFIKDSLTILTASGSIDKLPWYFPIFLILAVATAFFGLLMLSACMKRFDATYSSAMFVGSFVISASIMSAVHYQTFSHLETIADCVMYPFGLATLMGGVYLLVRCSHTKESHENDNASDVEGDTLDQSVVYFPGIAIEESAS